MLEIFLLPKPKRVQHPPPLNTSQLKPAAAENPKIYFKGGPNMYECVCVHSKPAFAFIRLPPPASRLLEVCKNNEPPFATFAPIRFKLAAEPAFLPASKALTKMKLGEGELDRGIRCLNTLGFCRYILVACIEAN
ncbi:unnamed protein product [Ceratitis capitata]|uniref:(Mediterranean fruit fly) hypothetical protein n=1 Tax=Ceratitis capitata TaxID=7213 RepID=A0A811U6F5_CERCA|nr:unnamed protein product [Ceratitis capitata]